MPVFRDDRTRILMVIPDGWFKGRIPLFSGGAECIADFHTFDDVLGFNVMVGPSMGIDTLEQNRQLFRRDYGKAIIKEGTVTVDGVEQLAGVYSLEGLIFKRYVIVRQNMEYAITCTARLGLNEFKQMAEPVFDGIVSSLQFL